MSLAMKIRSLCVVATLLAGLVGAAAAQPVKFTLEVSPRRASMADTFFATVIVETSGVSGPERYWAPRFPGFNVIDRRNEQGSSMRVDPKAGRSLVTQDIRRYQLKAKRPGNFFIEPARIRLKGVEYETKGAYVTVTPRRVATPTDSTVAESRAPDPTASGGVGAPGFKPPDPWGAEPLFLHPVVDKRKVYAGEQVTVTWLLYTRKEILKFEPKPPNVEGMWTEVLHEPAGFFKYFDTMVGRRPYSVVIVSKRAVFPTKAGSLRISPMKADVVTLGSPMGRAERIRSPSVRLRVRPLPKGAPEGFDPTYVGRFDVETSIDRGEIDAGQSFILKLTVRGTGAIRRLTTPRVGLEGFSVREPTEFTEKLEESSAVVSGSRTYEYWITPEAGGPQTIPSVSIPYFDPSTGQYEVARSKPIPLLVRGDPSKLEAPRVGNRRDNVIARDIRLIHTSGSGSSRLLPGMYRRWWFLLLLGLPPLLYLILVLTDRILRRMRRETPRARLRRARGNAKRRFRLAEIHLRGNRPNKFFGELSRVILEHLEERLDKPVQALTREKLAEVLMDAGFSRTTVGRISKELDECDFARFSASGASIEEMNRAMNRVKELLASIEKTRLQTEAEEEGA